MRYGVTVALQILVLSVQVRILVSQPQKLGIRRAFCASDTKRLYKVKNSRNYATIKGLKLS